MFENTQHVYQHLLAPLVAAQIFLVVLIYFTIVRKRIASTYKLYVCFLATFIIFLVTRPVQHFGSGSFPYLVVFRMSLLFAVAMPSLLVAVFVQSGFRHCRALYGWAFGAGALFALAYSSMLDAAWWGLVVTPDVAPWLAWPVKVTSAHRIQIVGTVLMLVLPCTYLIVKELRSNRNSKLLAFLAGSLLFGVLLALGTMKVFDYSIYYVGSIFSALCWAWAVYQDVHDMKGKVTLLKEELQLLVQSGQESIAPEVEKLLGDLEELSNGNMAVYKMRIREILSMLTDATIEAGGDTEELVQRNSELAQEIDSSSDPSEMRDMVRSEAVELSEMIAEIPERQISVTVERGKAHIEAHFNEDLSVDAIAEALGLSRSHFMREFKKGAGQTVNQYLTSFRIDQAKALLAEKSVTETAFEVGYNNSNYFSTVFKKQTGMSPVQFQESLKEA